ncbi:MAG: 50S ribosomal protein L21 [bacterium]
MYAVVRIAGFQFLAREGETITVPRLEAETGSTVRFDDVLFLRTAGEAQVGTPGLKDSYIEAEVIAHPRADKVTVFKFRRRENYRRKRGHRQQLTKLRVAKIHKAG